MIIKVAITAFSALGVVGLLNLGSPQQEKDQVLKLQHQIKEWKKVLQEGEFRRIEERAEVVSRISKSVLSGQKLNSEQMGLFRSEVVPLLMEEARRIERISENPPSREWLWEKAEFLGEYLLSILSIINQVADESMVDFLVGYLRTGKGVADALARIGMPALPAILAQMERDYEAIIPACFALEAIARNQRERGDVGNLKVFKEEVLPALGRLRQSVQPDDTATLEKLRETTSLIQDILQRSSLGDK